MTKAIDQDLVSQQSTFCSGADIPVRANSKFAIRHDKYIVVDEIHVQTGSFNYSQAAANSNSENVLVISFDRTLALSYLLHWRSRFNQATTLKLNY
jgi:phosphatidylserine/phosphatidylglycerophosphate/cardiolipin synthase-like enzyme